MNEVIGTILEAEERAQAIVREGDAAAKQILEEGTKAAEGTIAAAERTLMSERETRLAAAEREAAARYGALYAEGRAVAEKLRAECQEKIGTAAEAAVRKVFGE